MKAPFSTEARKIFSDEEAAREMMDAVRKGETTEVTVDGVTYIVGRTPKFDEVFGDGRRRKTAKG
jgi:hypothetical protein